MDTESYPLVTLNYISHITEIKSVLPTLLKNMVLKNKIYKYICMCMYIYICIILKRIRAQQNKNLNKSINFLK